MSAHIIGRPEDNLVDLICGPGADPERAFMGGNEKDPAEGDGFEDRLLGEEPTLRQQ
jgi:hypothetical protein